MHCCVSGGDVLGNKAETRAWKLEYTSKETKALKDTFKQSKALTCVFASHRFVSGILFLRIRINVSDLLLQSLEEDIAQYRFMPRLMNEQMRLYFDEVPQNGVCFGFGFVIRFLFNMKSFQQVFEFGYEKLNRINSSIFGFYFLENVFVVHLTLAHSQKLICVLSV